MSAILFGSIGTLVDTSELQREAFNQALTAHGIAWQWDREEYLELLEVSGGRKRIAAYASARGETVDAEAVHKTKTELFQKRLRESQRAPRAGVVETIREGKAKGYKVALVTTTTAENVSLVIGALSPHLARSDFDLIVDVSSVERPKPDAAAYAFALARLDDDAADCVAIEDNLDGVEAATAAQLNCVAFPNENTADHAFDKAILRLERLSFPELQTVIPSRLTEETL